MITEYIGLIITIIFFSCLFIFEFLIPALEIHKKNKKIIKQFGKRIRKKCIECKYCKWFWYHPFYKYGQYGNLFVTKTPEYCRKIKKPLKNNETLRCVINDLEFTEFEENSNSK